MGSHSLEPEDAVHTGDDYRPNQQQDRERRALISADGGAQNLLRALAAYEPDMIDYGFKAVGVSLPMMRRVRVENPIQWAMGNGHAGLAHS
jgi:hypothetical protein